MTRSDRVATVGEAKGRLRQRWDDWKDWAKLGEVEKRCAGRTAASEGMTPEYLAQPLTPFPLPTTDGWMLRTIGDTGAYILALPKRRKRLAHWEQVRRLIVKE